MSDGPRLPDPKSTPPPAAFGPAPVDPRLVPAAAPLPPARTPAITPERLRRAGIVLGAAVPPLYLEWTSAAVRGASIGGFLALYAGTLSLIACALRIFEAKKEPSAHRLATLAAGSGAFGLLVGGAWGHLLRADAEKALRSDVVLEPGMREYLAYEAHHFGRVAGGLAFVALPGALVGLLLLLMVIGERRMREADAKRRGEPYVKSAPVWVAFAGAGASVMVGVIVALVAVFREVPDATHPHAALLVTVREAAGRHDLKVACEGLERALEPGYVPASVFEAELPDGRELAKECITLELARMSREGGCHAAKERLEKSPVVRLAGDKDRVASACP